MNTAVILNKEEYTKEVAMVWSKPDMIKHVVNDACISFLLRNVVVSLDKKKIETSFCFGYECFGGVDTSSEAREAEEVAKRDFDLFRHNNMREHNELLDRIEEGINGEVEFVLCKGRYCSQPQECRLGYIIPLVGFNRQRVEYTQDDILTVEELKIYRDMVLASREKFEKRVNTYLKNTV